MNIVNELCLFTLFLDKKMKGTFSSQIKRKIERINENIMKDLNFNILTLVTILAASGSQKKLNSAAKN